MFHVPEASEKITPDVAIVGDGFYLRRHNQVLGHFVKFNGDKWVWMSFFRQGAQEVSLERVMRFHNLGALDWGFQAYIKK